MTEHQIIHCDSKRMDAIPDQSVQLIVTSPPYPMIELWDGLFIRQDPSIRDDLTAGRPAAAFEKMHRLLDGVWAECDRVLALNGFLCINIGDATRTLNGTFQLYSNHARVIQFFAGMGYCVLPDILWRKPSNSPNKFMGSGMYPAGAYVTYEHEYILIFRKGGKREFRGSSRTARQKSAYFWEERNVWFSDLWEINGTSQALAKTVKARSRNASFPLEIPYRLVNMFSIQNDTVLDPFCGFGTTNLACMISQRNSIGCEIDPEIARRAEEALFVSPDVLNRPVTARLDAHRAFLASLSEEAREKCYQNPYHQFLVKTRQETAIELHEVVAVQSTQFHIRCFYQK